MISYAKKYFYTHALNKPFQNLELNFASQSEITVLGIPCNLKTSYMNIYTMLMALKVDFIGIKCIALLILSTTTIIESHCILFFGKPMMKSMDIIPHFNSGMGKGYNNQPMLMRSFNLLTF